MNFHAYFNADRRIVEACVIGTGGFGRSLLAQARRVPLLSVRVGVDISAEAAAAAMRDVGIPEADIRICGTPDEAAAAFANGAHVAAGDFGIVSGLPFEVVVEATGHPEHGARHAKLAIEAGKHVAMVSKEVDSVVGPGLAALAAERNLIVTPVDGDQPSLLIGLITWAETLGFEIIAAGKSSEYDFVFDPEAGTLWCNGRTVDAPDFASVARMGARTAAELVAARAKAASALPQRAVPDLCEMTIVANNCGLGPDRADLHCPIARIDEVPAIFCGTEDGGLLNQTGVLDVFHCLREPGEISFAGGVFVVIRCEHAETWEVLREKGHIVAENGKTAMVFIPRHLLGLEAAISILEVALNKVSSGAIEVKHHIDLAIHADQDLPAGHLLEMGGHHHSIAGVSARMIPALPLDNDSPAPFYLAANCRLSHDVKAGELIRMRHLVIPEGSTLAELRALQDSRFHTVPRFP
ncbi:NAD(P)H-dependent oxidoreductase [Oricola thermophila]|uniref:Flagellar biosynthesis protein FlgA n=1 Tax=Oricola thermophila TaxID=2742145 RepID=A0A6N1VMH3_9HYPH|nr:flagellar biosynthesis protein FlgA [Oricola thermophila]QKV20632.1 flagellar biosynthesis protein FlgA [Oricola thermophila]